MDLKKLEEAKNEAERFLKKVKQFEDRVAIEGTHSWNWGLKESGSVKRSSMDLSRSLSNLRKSN